MRSGEVALHAVLEQWIHVLNQPIKDRNEVGRVALRNKNLCKASCDHATVTVIARALQ
jgi:hypothetical protein